jgi:hypothetical protein
MIQQIILFLLFAGALFYLGRLIYQSFASKDNCAKGCSGCNAVDIEKIQKQIEAQQQERKNA